jgi:hypothetical protein
MHLKIYITISSFSPDLGLSNPAQKGVKISGEPFPLKRKKEKNERERDKIGECTATFLSEFPLKIFNNNSYRRPNIKY